MIGPLERRKDTIQLAVESAFGHVGQIAAIIAEAGRDVTREIGDWATDLFEIREAAQRAERDEAQQSALATEPFEALEPEPAVRRPVAHGVRRPLRRR